MTTYYLDTSALVKLFVQENGSKWLERLTTQTNEQGHLTHLLIFSQLSIVEFSSALARKTRSGQISDPAQQELLSDFRQHLNLDFFPLLLTNEILWQAARLTHKRALRAYDAIHLATAQMFIKNLSAQEISDFVFISADDFLLSAARAEALATENPNTHSSLTEPE